MKISRRWVASLACATTLASAPCILAQVDDPNAREGGEESTFGGTHQWGTINDSFYNVGPDDFSVRLLGWSNAQLFNNSQILPANPGVLDLSGPIHLQDGALVTALQIFYTDNNTTSDPSGQFYRASPTGVLTNMQSIVFPAGFSGGFNQFVVNLPAPGITIDNLLNTYAVNFSLTRSAAAPTQTHALIRVRVFYRLQVSPPPPVATFNDVPTSDPRFRFVQALVASGLTGGCGGGNFCPDQAVTRGQMAVFLSSALGLTWP
jgi:hypothetical protein